ncbi:MAG: TraR/DksA family transcriptional regulator [Lacipirellulaceae bacterium]
MNKAEMQAYRDRLVVLRGRLRGDVTAMVKTALHKSADDAGGASSMPIHMAELGSDNFEQEFTLSLMESEEGTLTLIETALERVERGVYGKCAECEGVIPKQRLNAIPYAVTCVRCAEKLENGSHS